MNHRLEQILKRQQASGFADLQGAETSVTLPVSDRLLNEILADGITLPSQVREIEVHAHARDRIAVRVKLAMQFVPPINLTVVIAGQPELPASAVLVLKLELGALLSLAGTALRFIDAPAGIRVDHDRVYVDLARLALDRGLESWLVYLEHLNLHTVEGALVITLRAAARTPGNV
jgi:hypothetical protein